VQYPVTVDHVNLGPARGRRRGGLAPWAPARR